MIEELIILALALHFMVADGTNYSRCDGTYGENDLICYYTIFEPEKPLQLNIKMSMPNHGPCDERCLNYTFTSINFLSSTGSIGGKTFSLLTQTENLNLYSGDIKQIEDRALCTLPNLKSLELGSEYHLLQIPTLNETLLTNCYSLKNISLWSIPIEKHFFKSIPGLESLSMKGLDIPILTKDYLSPLINLKSLEISNCMIEKIMPGAICLSSKLENITIISSEPLATFTEAIFENCGNVTELYLKFIHNQILEEGAFSTFTKVINVTIIGANIEHLKKQHLRGLSNVEILKIIDSDISKIDHDSFGELNNLTELYLDLNYLTEFDSDIVASLPNLVKLSLRYNELRDVDTIKHQNLEKLWLTNNDIKSIDAERLKLNLPNLKKLNIENNPISEYDREDIMKELKDVVIDTFWEIAEY